MNTKMLLEKSMKEISLFAAKQSVNTACLFWLYQTKIPDSVWKMKKNT